MKKYSIFKSTMFFLGICLVMVFYFAGQSNAQLFLFDNFGTSWRPLSPTSYAPSAYIGGVPPPEFFVDIRTQPDPDYFMPYGFGWNQPYSYNWDQPSYGWDAYNYMYPSNYNPYSYTSNQPSYGYGWNQPSYGWDGYNYPFSFNPYSYTPYNYGYQYSPGPGGGVYRISPGGQRTLIRPDGTSVEIGPYLF